MVGCLGVSQSGTGNVKECVTVRNRQGGIFEASATETEKRGRGKSSEGHKDIRIGKH